MCNYINELSNVFAIAFNGKIFEYKDFSHPIIGFEHWRTIANSLHTEKSIKTIRQQEEKWLKSFVSFAEVSYCTNMFSPTWSIERRHRAGDIAKKALLALRLYQDLNKKLPEIAKWLTDISQCCDDENYYYDSDSI